MSQCISCGRSCYLSINGVWHVKHCLSKTSMLLEMNVLKSPGKRSFAINLGYFWMTGQIKEGTMIIEYCLTGNMKAGLLGSHSFESS